MTQVLNKNIKEGKYIFTNLNDYKLTIGTVNSKQTKSIYSTLSGYVKPVEDCDLNSELNRFSKYLKVTIRDAVNQLLPDVIDTKMPIIILINNSDTNNTTNSQRVNNTWTFFEIDVTLYFKQNINLNEYQNNFELINMVNLHLMEEDRYLNFKPKK
jgi:hypothetical protein